MYAITGITGKVGGTLAEKLLEDGASVRAVLRDEAKGASWAARGCELALARMDDAGELAAAFKDVEGVFILPPSDFDPLPGYPEARRVIDAVVSALAKARPRKVVCLSTIGADAPHDNLLTQRTMLEDALRDIGLPVTFLRAAWFMDNAAWDVASARDEGVLHSFLQPADKAFSMVASGDVGRLAADLVRQEWTGTRVIELEGPSRVTPINLANAFATALGRPVRVETVARDHWEDIFRAQGMAHPLPRARMLDGFNEGWIEFHHAGRGTMKGETTLAEVIASLVKAEAVNGAA